MKRFGLEKTSIAKTLLAGTSSFVFSFILCGAAHAAPSDDFFASLKALCGKTYGGYASAGSQPDMGLEGKQLRIAVAGCTDNEVRLGLLIAGDPSMDIVINRTPTGLMLTHKTLNTKFLPDLAPYGGISGYPSTATHQEFRLNNDSKTILAKAGRGPWQDLLWTMNLIGGPKLTYEISRPNYRSRLEFDLSKVLAEAAPVNTPQAKY